MTAVEKIKSSVVSALGPALKTGIWIIKITIPVSFGVFLLKVFGLMPAIAAFFAPLFAWVGMPGEAALVFVTACFVNLYACIGVIETLSLSGNTVTLLALMCLISHNLPVESAVQKKTGTPLWRIICIRLGCSLAGVLALTWLLPPQPFPQVISATGAAMTVTAWGAEFQTWLITISWLCAKILVLITLLMILQRILEAFGVIQYLSRMLQYPLMAMGLPRQAAFLWIVANTLGLAYGAGVIIDHVERGRLSREHADILNYHIAVSHSLLEDTLLFVAIGVSAGWITLPRLILATGVVWLKRLLDRYRTDRPSPAAPR